MKRSFIPGLLALLATTLLGSSAWAQSIVQEFYVALPETQIRQHFLQLASGTGTTFESVVSVTVGNNGTRVIYDHWEDGYEVDLNNPTQPTTQIWGDGNNANGKPPGYANDPVGLPAGTVIALRNLVSLPRNASQVLYDGRDRIGANNAVVVSRAAWATNPGSVLADGVELLSTADWGTSYTIPIGEDVIFPTPLSASMFEKTALFVQAAENGTQVQIDKNADGVTDTTVTLNRGEVHFVLDGVLKGATVTSSKPVQVHVMAGDVNANYETRWFTMVPRSQWGIEYFSPVGTASDGNQSYAFLYNPHASQITVTYRTRVGTGTFNIPAKSTYQFLLPQDSATSFASTSDREFFGIVTVGAKPSANQVHDWGFTLVPKNNLTTALVVGWGPGSSDLSQNGNPVWVTAMGATRIYVDYNGDRSGPLTDPAGQKYDVYRDISPLEVVRLYDPDKDQTAMRIYTLDGTLITAAWGQDPAVAGAGNPFLDIGTTVPAFPAPVMTKMSRILVDNGEPGASIGDIVEYTVRLENKSLVAITAVSLIDTLPAGVTYVPNTTKINLVPVADAGVTPFPMDEDGLVIPLIRSRAYTEVTFNVTIDNTGTFTNVVEAVGYPGAKASNTINVTGGSGSTICEILFTDSSGTPTIYNPGQPVFVTINDPDTSLPSINVAVINSTNGDTEIITLSSMSPGVYRNSSPLPTSSSAGTGFNDGTLYVRPGDILTTEHTDPKFADSCSANTTIVQPSEIKQLYLTTDASDNDATGSLDRIDPVATGDNTTSSTEYLVQTGFQTVAVQSTSTATGAAGTNSLSTTHATAAGDNRLMVVGVSYRDVSPYNMSVSSVTYGGTPLTRGAQQTTSNDDTVEIWYLTNPPVGSATVQVTTTGASGNDSMAFGVTTFTGVNQSAPFGTFATNGATSTSASVSVSSAAGDMVFAALAAHQGNTTATTAQTSRWNIRTLTGANGVLAAGSTTAGSNGNVGMSWTLSNSRIWAAAGVSIKPAIVGTATFAQTPNFVSPFSMPTGGALSGTAWVEVPNGYLTNTPNITAVLSRSGTNFASLTNPSATLVSGGAATITRGTTTTATANSTNSLTLTHNVASGTNSILMVSVALGATTASGNPPSMSGVTFRGTAMTLVGSRVSGTGGSADDTVSYIYRTLAPVTGNGNVVVSLGGNGSVAVTATTFYNVDQTTPLGTFVSNAGTSGSTASVTVSSAPGEVVFGTISADEAPTLTAGTGVTNLWSGSSFAGFTSGATGVADGAASVAFSYTKTVTDQDWAIVAVPIRPSRSAAVYRLDWSGVLSSGLTVPEGQAVTLTLQNNLSGTQFRVLYDSQTYPSRIDLPALTVIDTVALDVYDAPYPGGSLMPTVISGQTGYVRVSVTDPFGTYDITSVDLNIDGPGASGDVSTTLGAPRVVSDNGTVKIYEYPWVTTSATGGYTISATSHEGFEGTVKSARSTDVSVTQLDLGTPSTTVFSKNVYSPNETVCVTTTDLDENKDPNTVETVTVVVASGAGDSETIVLTETGPDTGIFSACIPASSTTPGSNDNGTIYAPPGTTLTVTYVDPDDPTDTSGDISTVPSSAASVKVTKTRLTPADGQAMVGESVSFRLRVSNTGPTTLATVSVADTFPAANLGFQSASITPTAVNSGSLSWSNIGPMAPGQTIDIIVYFTALASANPATNNVTVTATGGLTSNSSATVVITRPALQVTKTLVSPPAGPVAVGDEVVFSIQVQNTGDTAITELPLEDTYSGALFQFVSATPAPDGSGSGSIFWADLTGAGELAPGQSTAVSVTLRVLGEADPAFNYAEVLYATDQHGDPVPPDQSSASIKTAAASISGIVYEDLDGDNGFSAPDGRLAGVTVRLYTDPNGDGNPADGVLVGLTTTAADGSYAFLNLPLGNYVVVQEDQIGYVSVNDTAGSPTDNRVPVVVSTLEEYAGNNFLDRLLSTSTYGSISGQVRLDADSDGDMSDADSGIAGVVIELYTDPNGDGNPSDGVLLLTTTTNAGGNYNFPLVPPGNYVVVEVDPGGHVSTADSVNPNDNRIPVSLPESGTSTGNDFLDAPAGGPLATIGDRVWLDVNNNGLRDGGEPGVEGVVVWLYKASQTPGVDVPYRVTTTMAGGLYEFANLPVGSYTIMLPAVNFGSGGALVSAPLSSTITNINDDNIDDDDNGIQTGGPGTVVVSPLFALGHAAVDSTKDFGFVPNSSLGSIAGFVLADTDNNGSGDTPIEGVTLTLKDADGNDIDSDPNTPGVQPTTTTTAADGSYSFAGLPPGSYRIVETQPAGYVSVSDVDGGDLDIIGDVTPVVVAPGQTVANQTFVEIQLGSITGFVLADTDNNGIGDAPIEGVTLTLKDADGNDIDSDPNTPGVQPTTTTTAADGSYSFAGLPPGSYRIVETQPAGYVSVSDVDGGDLDIIGDVTPVVVAPGQTVANQTFVEIQLGAINGTVLADTTGDGLGDTPLANVTLTLKDADGNDIDSDPNTPGVQPTTTTSAGDGSYSFTGLLPGSYRVVQTVPAGYIAVSDADGGDFTVIGNLTPISVLPGQTVTGRDFTDAQLGSISGKVWLDTDEDDVGDANFAGVTLALVDENGAPVVDGNNDPITAVSGPDGSYSFGNIPPGTYGVQKTNPSGYVSVNDSDGGNPSQILPIAVVPGQNNGGNDFVLRELPGTISGRVMLDTDLDGSGDTPLEGVTLTLVDADGNPVLDGNDEMITTVTAPDGTYSFSGVPAGTYGVRMTPVTGAIGVSDADGGLVDWIGDTTDITLPPGGTRPDNDFLLRTQACPNTWEAWQDNWDLDNETPTGNDDGDIHTNLVEYAFCMDPKSGRGTPYCMSPSLEAVDKVDLIFRRTAGGTLDVTYEIEHAATLGAASTAWTTVAIPPANMVVTRRTDGTDMVRVTDLEGITGLTAGTGFVRMKVTLRDQDNQVVAAASTDVGGWIQTPLDYEVRSFNDPFLDCPIFTGTITAVEGQDIVTETSGGGVNYNALVTAQPSYAEILTGPYQGHRFDMAGGGVDRFTAVVDNDIYSGTAPFSTAASPQGGLVGAQFVVRPHRTIGSVFPARAFVPTDDPETASVVQMYAGDRWETLWLYNDGGLQDSRPAWVAVGDPNINDRSGDVIVPGQGGFIYSRHASQPGASFMLFGKVRPNDFVRPLRAGLNNVGGGYPLVQSPDGRAMTPTANSFLGDRDFKKADQFLLWRGDARQSMNAGYDTYFMIAGTATKPLPPNWVLTGDVNLVPQNTILHFKPDYSILLKRNGAAPGNRMPSPWKP